MEVSDFIERHRLFGPGLGILMLSSWSPLS
jgi:hypothetical protein